MGIMFLTGCSGRYGDSAVNGIVENSSIFSVIIKDMADSKTLLQQRILQFLAVGAG